MNERISVVINTYNAASEIRETLESLRGFDEIVVCDMESTDNTRDIAIEYGAKVVMFPKGNHNICEVARDFAIHSASSEWVLVVDADERVQPGLRDYLYKHISKEGCEDALAVPRAQMFMGHFISEKPERLVRFFRPDKAYWPPVIHAHVQIDGKTGMIPLHRNLMLEHYDDPTLSGRVEKINRYTDNEVEKRLGRNYSFLSFLFRPWLFFFKMLIIKGGVRDGKRGIVRAYMEMMYQAVMLGKHLERKESQCKED